MNDCARKLDVLFSGEAIPASLLGLFILIRPVVRRSVLKP